MKHRHRLKLTLLTGLILISSHGLVRGFPEYLKTYANDPQSRNELRAKCAVCHVSPAGGGARNNFGLAFERAGLRITPALRGQFPDLFTGLIQTPAVQFVDGSDSEAIVE
ncbi:MAG: hypothetical protein ACOYLF_13135, partial [Blastocatellia bacterium]